MRQRPISSRSMSSVRGALRRESPSRRRCCRRSIACSAASSARGRSVVRTAATAFT